MAKKEAKIMAGPVLRVQRANRFVWDTQGYWHCTIVSIVAQDAPDPTRAPRFRWTVEGEGTVRPWRLHFSTGSELSGINGLDDEILTEDVAAPEEAGVQEVATPNTTLLAKICLTLQLIAIDDLEPEHLDDTLERFDLAQAIGLVVRCKIAQRNTVFLDGAMRPCNPYYVPVLDTLEREK